MDGQAEHPHLGYQLPLLEKRGNMLDILDRKAKFQKLFVPVCVPVCLCMCTQVHVSVQYQPTQRVPSSLR